MLPRDRSALRGLAARTTLPGLFSYDLRRRFTPEDPGRPYHDGSRSKHRQS
jgi:hypothetical protein